MESLTPANVPTSILGCWVINHHYQAKRNGQYVEVAGKFEVNVWYAFSNHSKTAVHTETVQYKDRIKLHFRDGENNESNDVLVKVLQQPNCVEAVISPCGQKINVTIEREFLVELVGETTVTVSIHPLHEDDDWQFHDESSSKEKAQESLDSSSLL